MKRSYSSLCNSFIKVIYYLSTTHPVSFPTNRKSTEIPANQVQWPFSIQPIRSSAWRVIEFQVKQICLPWSWVLLMRFWINRPTKIWCCVSCISIQHLKWPLIECISNTKTFTCSFFSGPSKLYEITHTLATGIQNACSCYDQMC